jgi:hypothetical protein
MSKKIKVKWTVYPPATGKWRSFETRSWPYAEYQNENACACINCEDEYIPSNVKSGNHQELTLRIADYSKTPWKWVKAKVKPKTLKEAKELLIKILTENPELAGDNLQE